MNIQEFQSSTIKIFGAASESTDHDYGVYAATIEERDIFAHNPLFWNAPEDGDPTEVDYDSYYFEELTLDKGEYTVIHYSSESGDHGWKILEGLVEDYKFQQAKVMQGAEDWWSVEGMITDPMLGLSEVTYEDEECLPGIDDVHYIRII